MRARRPPRMGVACRWWAREVRFQRDVEALAHPRGAAGRDGDGGVEGRGGLVEPQPDLPPHRRQQQRGPRQRPWLRVHLEVGVPAAQRLDA